MPTIRNTQEYINLKDELRQQANVLPRKEHARFYESLFFFAQGTRRHMVNKQSRHTATMVALAALELGRELKK